LSEKLDDLTRKTEQLTVERSELERKFASASREAASLLKAAEADVEQQGKYYREAKSELEAARTTLVANEEKLAERFKELAALTQLLGAQERRNREVREQVEWLVAFSDRLRTQPRWWSLMPVPWRRAREARRLKNAGLFDGEAYLAVNPDVAAHGHDPLRHYMTHGIYEGRERA
jgi:DNA repair exonuclease SbcCD ATPase subunit